MFSKRKMAEATTTWIRQQLEGAMNCGSSLRDDTDGVSVRVERVRQSGTLIFLTIRPSVDDVNADDLEYCLQLQQKIPADLPGKPPTPEDLQEIDDTP